MDRGPPFIPGEFGHAGQSSMARQWRLLRLICQHPTGLTIQALAAHFGISQRSVQRDLNMLQNIGFPLESRHGPHGRKYWRCNEMTTQSFPAEFGGTLEGP